jgi:predicted TIM-barrel fold metal-dependent hydrolase
MSEPVYDAHVHFGPSTQWVPYVDPVVSIEELNDIMASAQKEHPDRIIGFGRVDPRRENEAVAELKRFKDLELSGVKLHPYVECFRPDHPFFDEFWGTLNDLNLSILIHTGTMFSSPGFLKPVLKKYPELKIILGHLQESCISLMRDFENVYSDTSGSRVHLLEYAQKTCSDKILFGSDYPYLSHSVQMEVVRASDIPGSVKNRIFSGNFRDFFDISP